MNMKRKLVAASVLAALSFSMTAAYANPLDEGKSGDVLMQGFHWLSVDQTTKESTAGAWWYNTLATKAADVDASRFNMIWFPPASIAPSFSKNGYIPTLLNNLDSYYGTKTELKTAIDAYKQKGIKVLADIVINHRGGTKGWCDFTNPAWPNAITAGDEAWSGTNTGCNASTEKGGNDSGENYGSARDLDHSNTAVQDGIKAWMSDLLKGEMGFDGWRYDFIKGYDGKYNGIYNKATSPYFSVGEMWQNFDPAGGFGAKPDDHRQQLLNWVNATDKTSAIFDFTNKGILNFVLGYYDGQWKSGTNDYGLFRDSQGRPAGLLGLAPRYAVTFVDNHDTGPSTNANDGQRHWQLNNDKVAEAYAYILTHPGIPTVYWGHYFEMGFKAQIDPLIDARKAAGIHSESPVTIKEARSNLYAAVIEGTNGRIAMKMGGDSWTPPTDGTWEQAASGNGYAVWTETAGNKAPVACFTPNSATGIKVGDAITFDASCSTDSDGTIASYAWSGAATGAGKTITIPFNAEVKYDVTLTVTDDAGKSNVKTLSINLGKDFAKVYDQVYVRGTFNTWLADTKMTLTNDNTWEAKGLVFAAAGRFKFDIFGDWKTNFGDNEQDGIADGGDSKDILVSSAGTYDVVFNDSTKAYQVNPATGCTADNDGMPKAWEEQYGLDDCDASDAATDLDGDTLSNLAEFKLGTNPTKADTDSDGMPDSYEAKITGLDPTLNDAASDLDKDGYTNLEEYKANTNPADASDHPGQSTTTSGAGVKHAGDFNGDGVTDFIWRNSKTGENWISLTQKTALTIPVTSFLNKVASDWAIVGLADFDADGTDDILWRNQTSGDVYVYLMGQGKIASQKRVGRVADLDWQIVGAADFDGDAKADILWRHAKTGLNYIYFMNGASIVSQKVLNKVAVEWSVQALADLNGDAKADIVWRNTQTGVVYGYLLNGTSILSQGLISKVSDLQWTLVGAADFNGDGKADLLWRNLQTGANVVYLMNGLSFTQAAIESVKDTNWEATLLGDFNGDGLADIYWRNKTTGGSYTFVMNGAQVQQRFAPFKNIATEWSVATGGSTSSSSTVVIVEPKEVVVGITPAGGDFVGSVTVTLKVSGGTISNARYTLDGSDPKSQGTSFEDGTKVVIGADAADGTSITLKVYADNTDDRSALQSYTFVKKPKVIVVSGNKPYSTNPTFGKRVANGSITIDGSGSEWSDDMLIAIDAANDDPRSLGSAWSMHETPLDLSHLWAAWDDQYLYIAWQYVNVTDVVDSSNASSTGPVSANQMPQWIAIDTVAGQGAELDVWGKNFGKPYWTGADKPEYQLYLFTNLWAGMVKAGNQGVIADYDSSLGKFPKPDSTTGYHLFVDQGIEAAFSLGLVPSKLWMVADADDAVENTIADADLVDAMTKGHKGTKDVFFEIRIPLAALGNPDIDNTGLGLMLGQGDGSPVDTIPNDPGTSDTAEVSESNSPMEWADIDSFTVPFARVGK